MRKFNRQRLIDLMIEKDISQADLARQTQLTPACINYLVNSDGRDPQGETLISIAAVLGVNASYFYTEENDDSAPAGASIEGE